MKFNCFFFSFFSFKCQLFQCNIIFIAFDIYNLKNKSTTEIVSLELYFFYVEKIRKSVFIFFSLIVFIHSKKNLYTYSKIGNRNLNSILLNNYKKKNSLINKNKFSCTYNAPHNRHNQVFKGKRVYRQTAKQSFYFFYQLGVFENKNVFFPT